MAASTSCTLLHFSGSEVFPFGPPLSDTDRPALAGCDRLVTDEPRPFFALARLLMLTKFPTGLSAVAQSLHLSLAIFPTHGKMADFGGMSEDTIETSSFASVACRRPLRRQVPRQQSSRDTAICKSRNKYACTYVVGCSSQGKTVQTAYAED